MTTDRMPPAVSLKIVPPMWVAAGVLVELALFWWIPVASVIPAPVRYVGALILVLGISLAVAAARLFKRAKTGLVPFSPSTALVIEGPYRFTRNPMYLGMTLALLGVAVLLGAVTPFIVPPAFMVLITLLFIRPEEAHMERAFGTSYEELKKTVRRWL